MYFFTLISFNNIKERSTVKNILIKKVDKNKLDCIENIYKESIIWLDNKGINQWKIDVYPTRKTAFDAIIDESLYGCFINDKIAGTFIINEKQPYQYKNLKWKYKEGRVLVLHTLVVRPYETGKGLGKNVMLFVINYAKEKGYSSIRLDVFPDNKAAVKLYLSFKFEYVGKVFFEIKEPGYEWYDCYEKFIL